MVRVRYTPNELGESGIVENLDADKFEVLEDSTVKLTKLNEDSGKYRVVGFIHPHRWESIVLVDERV